jgi:hypothetical protein
MGISGFNKTISTAFLGKTSQDRILDLIVERTNQKIEEDFLEKNYSEDTIAKSPHISQVDKVPSPCNKIDDKHFLLSFFIS